MMKKHTILSIITAAALLGSGGLLMAEEAEMPMVTEADGSEITEETKVETEIISKGEIQPELEDTHYTRFGSYAYGGYDGVGVGYRAGVSSHDSSSGALLNAIIGSEAAVSIYDGDYNTVIGGKAGSTLHNGNHNALYGYKSGHDVGETQYNTFIGSHSGGSAGGADKSVFLGYWAGYNADNADGSVLIGYYAGAFQSRANTLMIDNSSTNSPLIYGEFDNNLLRVNGKAETIWSGSNSVGDGLTEVMVLEATNSNTAKVSDAGFILRNGRSGKQWNFRTTSAGDGFAATVNGTGGLEFQVENTTTYYKNTVVKMGGVTVFKNGHLVNTSGNEITSLIDEQSKTLAKMEAKDIAVEAALKAKDLKIAMMEAKIVKLETMQNRLARVESLLTNLALATSNTKTEKVTLNSK